MDVCGEKVYSITTNQFISNNVSSQKTLYGPVCIQKCPGMIVIFFTLFKKFNAFFYKTMFYQLFINKLVNSGHYSMTA